MRLSVSQYRHQDGIVPFLNKYMTEKMRSNFTLAPRNSNSRSSYVRQMQTVTIKYLMCSLSPHPWPLNFVGAYLRVCVQDRGRPCVHRNVEKVNIQFLLFHASSCNKCCWPREVRFEMIDTLWSHYPLCTFLQQWYKGPLIY